MYDAHPWEFIQYKYVIYKVNEDLIFLIHDLVMKFYFSELAWELDKKALHHHKMQRTPIKLSLFAQNNGGSERESIGYLVLDLRTAGTKQHTGKWLPILSNKYTKFKCEMNVQLGLEEQRKGFNFGFKHFFYFLEFQISRTW